MPLEFINGCICYAYGDDRPYEAESAYYMNFQIVSALASLDHLISLRDDGYEWENRFEYYHYYSDHLLFSMGQIANRLIDKENDNEEKRKRKESNRNNFQFSKDRFPLLSDKRPRNAVEHIDERNLPIIKEHQGVGGFNLIDADVEEQLIVYLREHKDTHPYTLDLLSGALLIRDKEEDLTIDFKELKAELSALQDNVKFFLNMMHNAAIMMR